MPRKRPEDSLPAPDTVVAAPTASSPDKELLRGKYPASRFPQLAEHPDIDPGQYWPEGRPVPEGFKTDRSERIWPIPVKKGRVAPDEKRCHGTTRDGLRCPNTKMNGRNHCRMHGGAERAGAEHPNTKTGEQFRNGLFGDLDLPASLSDWYQNGVTDPMIYDLSSNIAILVGRERELLAGLKSGEAKANWNDAGKRMDDLRKALDGGDDDQVLDAMRELQATIRAGRSYAAIYAEFVEIGEKKRKLIESERKRRMDLKMVISAERMREILRAATKATFREIELLPSLVLTLMEHEGHLDTNHLTQWLTARIGSRLDYMVEGMKYGRVDDNAEMPANFTLLPAASAVPAQP